MEAAAPPPGPDAAAAATAQPLPPPATVAELHELMRRLGECVLLACKRLLPLLT